MSLQAADFVQARIARRQALTLPVFAATIFLSAFLLFSVQPFFARMVLPRLGGSPAVWSVAMVFFQSVLLLGYGWAHLITTRLRLRHAAIAHLGVILLAFIALPIAIPQGWSEPPTSGQAFWLLGLFAFAVGLPFFAVSANGPLLQAWFARTGHPHADDPYFLYGASNIGSFASLILFIIAIEPLFTVSGQSLAWTAGFALLAALIALCALLAGKGSSLPAAQPATTSARNIASEAVSWRRIGGWVLMAALPSALLVAVTAHISMDIAAAPFLWVVPLALFLLTFVIAFSRRNRIRAETIGAILPLLAGILFISMGMGSLLPTWLVLLCHLAFFFLAALMAHLRLVADRPAASGLTGFYFWMSLGGVLGGAFTTLVSPALFAWVAEYPLLILAALLLRPGLGLASQREMLVVCGLALLAAIAMNLPFVIDTLMPRQTGFYALAIAGFAFAAALIRYRSEPLHAAFAILAVGLLFVVQSGLGTLSTQRSFYGVVKAFETPDGRFTVMAHGTTEHGAMRNEERGSRPTPIAYYHESGGIARALFAAQAKGAKGPLEVGLVGLGAGAMLCHRRDGENWTSYEIDQAVVDVASDPAIFGFVPLCGQDSRIVVGDARLTLAREPAGRFDYLLIDAFSSDSIPVHLLTAEAIELYRSRLKPDGMLVFHISNRYMELRSVIAALADQAGMTGRAGQFQPPEHLRSGEHVNPSEVAVLAMNEAALGSLGDDPAWQRLDAGSTRAWTDDYANILAAIWRGL